MYQGLVAPTPAPLNGDKTKTLMNSLKRSVSTQEQSTKQTEHVIENMQLRVCFLYMYMYMYVLMIYLLINVKLLIAMLAILHVLGGEDVH